MSSYRINPKSTIINKAISLNKFYANFLVKIVFAIFWIFGLSSILLIVAVQFLDYKLEFEVSLGSLYIMVGFFLFYVGQRNFYIYKIKHPKPIPLLELKEKIAKNEEPNIFSVFSFELAKCTKNIFGNKNPGTEADLIKSLVGSKDIGFILGRIGLSGEPFINLNYSGKNSIDKIILGALDIAIVEEHGQIEVGDVFAAFCQNSPEVKKMFLDLKLSIDDIFNVVYWQTKIMRDIAREKGAFNPEKLKLTGGIGKDWAYGWTPFLKQFSVDISRSLQESGLDMDIIGHDNEINQIKEALMRQNGGNAIVVGEAGIGKNTTILGFAKKVIEGKTYSDLDFKHIVKVDTDILISGLSNPGDITNRIYGLLSEAGSAGNIIIYFENIQNLLSSGDAGKVDATEVLLPFLEQTGVHVLATCDIADFNKYIAQNTALMERMTRITIEEPNDTEMVRILEDVVPIIEYRTKCILTYEAIKETIKEAKKYIMNLPNPEKSINLLDAAAARASSQRGKTIILPKDISDYVTEKYNIPAGDVEEGEKANLLQLETEMHKSIIGQNEAITAIANALRRVRAGVTDSKKPIGSFLFLGPTGVGKTETAKALARAYFGSEDKMIRFDMSEFQNKEDVYRFIGSDLSGNDNLGVLTTAIRERPFSLLLFDEVEKAHKDILDLFLQILDEGFITDGSGRKVSFSNSIIIATSNAGANLIRESIQNGIQYEKIKASLINFLQSENIYRPEFLNRFTSVIAFSPLSADEIKKVACLMINKMIATISQNKGITVSVDPKAIEKLAKLGFDPQMGARPMERVIQEKLENLLATKILSGQLKSGDSITIDEQDII